METARQKTCDQEQNQRILITNVNGLLGHSLFEFMRSDHITIKSEDGRQPHRFLGTLNTCYPGGMVTPPPSDTIKILDSKNKVNTFNKQVRGADVIVLDISQFGCDLDEAQKVLKALKYQDVQPEKEQVLIVVSSVMAWSKTKPKDGGDAYNQDEVNMRVPLPKYQVLKQLELTAQSLQKYNAKLRVHVVCSGLLYGNGEQNDIFYEFFRRAWVSLHPQLAALPVIGKGQNFLPTIHVNDLSNSIDLIVNHGHEFAQYLLAVDQSSNTQMDLMKAISEGIGSGAIQETQISEVINEQWCDFMTIDVKLETSDVLREGIEWIYPTGINSKTMSKLNDEFNYFRGLFPLKVFMSGPPCSGKTYFAQKLSEDYGIPHYTIQDIVSMGKQLTNDYGKQLKVKVEELIDQAEADYEKTRKKKDPDFDRSTCNPRFTDDILADLVKIQLNSAACMNKGFILDGFPRSQDDAKTVFMEKHLKPDQPEPVEGEEEKKPEYDLIKNDKILPQYSIILESDDASLIQKAKDLPAEKTADSHHNDAGMQRRLKEFRARNVEDSGATVKDFFTEAIGYQNVLIIDANSPEEEQLLKMKEIIEQKGKPCCINMITAEDRKFLAMLDKQAKAAERAKKRAERMQQESVPDGTPAVEEGSESKHQQDETVESEEEVDEVTQMILNEERENAEKAAQSV